MIDPLPRSDNCLSSRKISNKQNFLTTLRRQKRPYRATNCHEHLRANRKQSFWCQKIWKRLQKWLKDVDLFDTSKCLMIIMCTYKSHMGAQNIKKWKKKDSISSLKFIASTFSFKLYIWKRNTTTKRIHRCRIIVLSLMTKKIQ